MRYADIAELSEDERINLIAAAVKTGKATGFMVDKPGKDDSKGNRYIEKLKKLVPNLKVDVRVDGPVKNVEFIKVVQDVSGN